MTPSGLPTTRWYTALRSSGGNFLEMGKGVSWVLKADSLIDFGAGLHEWERLGLLNLRFLGLGLLASFLAVRILGLFC